MYFFFFSKNVIFSPKVHYSRVNSCTLCHWVVNVGSSVLLAFLVRAGTLHIANCTLHIEHWHCTVCIAHMKSLIWNICCTRWTWGKGNFFCLGGQESWTFSENFFQYIAYPNIKIKSSIYLAYLCISIMPAKINFQGYLLYNISLPIHIFSNISQHIWNIHTYIQIYRSAGVYIWPPLCISVIPEIIQSRPIYIFKYIYIF